MQNNIPAAMEADPSESEIDAPPTRVLTAVRIRPISAAEQRGSARLIVTTADAENPHEGSVIVCDPLFFSAVTRSSTDRKFYERRFNFDLSFEGGVAQELLFSKLGAPLIKHTLSGLNCSILAYGQTGSGKTYTMMGEDGSRGGAGVGVIPRILRGLLAEINRQLTETESDAPSNGAYRLQAARVSCSFYEIYNEKVYDLLLAQDAPSSSSSSSSSSSLSEGQHSRVRESSTEGAYVENLTLRPFHTYEEAHAAMQHGLRQRAVAETKMNATSSRSHAVFTINVKQSMATAAHGPIIERMSKIVLVDLAGSERASLTGATGERLIEANNINKSLSALGDVIKALSEGGTKQNAALDKPERSGFLFVPFRNSTLTWLLKDSLGGNSRTIMLACVSPADPSFNETVSTLRYIERAKYITTSAHVNESSGDPAFVVQLQKQIAILQEKLMLAHKSRQARDLELRQEFARREEELTREHDKKVADVQEQLQYYQQRALSPPTSPASVDASSPKSIKSPDKGGDADGPDGPGESLLDMSARELFCTTSVHPEAMVLQVEVARLQAQIEHKDALLGALERNAVGDGSRSSSSGKAEDKLKKLCLGYKEEKALVQRQYNALLLKLKSLAEVLESEREHYAKFEEVLVGLEEELQEKKNLTRRLEAAATACDEELQRSTHEIDFLKAKQSSALAKHHQELMLLQMQVDRAKEAEEAVRRDKEADLDKFTELMVDAQKRNEDDRKSWEATEVALVDKVAQLATAVAMAVREKERMRDALNMKLDDTTALEAELESVKAAGEAAREDVDGRNAELHKLRTALEAATASLEAALFRETILQSENTSLLNEVDGHRQAQESQAAELLRVNSDAQTKRQSMEAGEEFLKSALEMEALELKRALESVASTRAALNERDAKMLSLQSQMAELKAALQEETHARNDAEHREQSIATELTKRKKKLAAAIVVLDDNKARLATFSALEERLRAAEGKLEQTSARLAESEARHQKKDAKQGVLVAASADNEKLLATLEASLAAAHGELAEGKTALRSVTIEHSLLLDEVIELREQLDRESAESKKREQKEQQCLGTHSKALEDLETARADQYMSLHAAIAAADERCRLAEDRVETTAAHYQSLLAKAKGESEKRRIDATQNVQQRLDSILLGTDEFDAQYIAVQRVLSMIEMNMRNIDTEMKADMMRGDSMSNDPAADELSPLSRLAADFDSDKSHLSPKVVESLDSIFSRQQRLYGSVRGFKREIRGINCVTMAPTSPAAPASSPEDKGENGENGKSPTHSADHDHASLSQLIIQSKLALAISASENEEQTNMVKGLERKLCDCKLQIATLKSEIEDKNSIIGNMMNELTKAKGGRK